ncbi:C2 domain-containing protein [Blakeslea trispora]|nr:C2 domain-containing protein [Blakeslea trispora]
MSTPKIIGQLVIVAYKAVVGKQDPFVIFRIGETVERTKTDLRGGQHPVWDDQVTLPIPEKKDKVVVQVYDEDGKRQELISECELDISKVLADGEDDDWFELQYRGKPAGEIYLELTFYAAVSAKKNKKKITGFY